MRDPQPEAVLHSQVFFDMRAVHGDETLAARVRIQMREQPRTSPRFLAHLARIACDWNPPLGFFRGLVVARRGEYRNTLDVKAGGLAPVVQIARLYALASGVEAVATLDRFDAVAAAGGMGRADAENLSEAFRFLRGVAIRHHYRQIEAGVARDNNVDPSALSARDRHRLRLAFRLIAEAQDAVALRYRVGQL